MGISVSGCRVISSEAVDGPRGGPAGGVAIVVPCQCPIVRHRTLVPGYGVEATIRCGDEEVRVVSLYLPLVASKRSWTRSGLRSPRLRPLPCSWQGT